MQWSDTVPTCLTRGRPTILNRIEPDRTLLAVGASRSRQLLQRTRILEGSERKLGGAAEVPCRGASAVAAAAGVGVQACPC